MRVQFELAVSAGLFKMLNIKFYFDLLYIIAIIDSRVIRKSQSYQKAILSVGAYLPSFY